MINATATLARSITRAGSKQTYYTARLLVDKDLVDDCYRAYAYFRWADDRIDICSQSKGECVAFIERQKKLVDRLYNNDRPHDLTPEEEILADLLPRNVAVQVFRALLENAASEQGARMSAMDNATRNAGEMIDNLTLSYNRQRQAQITKELIEIISGAEAL